MGKPEEAATDTWMGTSNGRWDGDTLVVDVTGFNDQSWFDRAGDFHSDALHVVERYSFLDPNTLNYEATIEDRFDRQVTAFNPAREQNQEWKTEAVIGGSSSPVYTIENKLTMEDIRDPGIEYLLKGQTIFFLLGTALSALTILSAKFLKETPTNGYS